jgi:hypothetical protein
MRHGLACRSDRGRNFRRRTIQLRPWLVINTAGQFRLEEGKRAQVIPGSALKRFTVSVNRLHQLSARGLGIVMLVVAVAFSGSLTGAGFASAQSLLPGDGGASGPKLRDVSVKLGMRWVR